VARQRLSMRKIKEVLRLRWECKLPRDAVARSCGISGSTVTDYLARATQAGLSWPLPEGIGEEELDRRLYPDSHRPQVVGRPLPDWNQVLHDLGTKGVTLQLLWQEYRGNEPEGYGYSQFCELYRRWSVKLNPVLRMNHKAGEKCYVDYSGTKLHVVDPATGEISDVELFVGAIGVSSLIYAEAQPDQKLPRWIGAHVRMFREFGGVSHVLVPDNLKSGVKHACHYEPELNPTYHDFASHHGIAVIPTGVNKPKHKAKVENAVLIAQRWIIAVLRNRTFFSLSELNEAIGEAVDAINNRKMRGIDKSRRELFEEIDKPALKPLPAEPYEYALIKHAGVGIDYHVQFDDHFYSVPFTLLKQAVLVRATEGVVEIFHKGKRVASHKRNYGRARYSTHPDHRPPSHKYYMDWSPERFTRWSEKIGPNAKAVIENRLGSRQHPEQSFRACQGILKLAEKYTPERLEAACTKAMKIGITSYKRIKLMLDNKMENIDASTQGSLDLAPMPTHENVRGNTYYQ